MTDETGLTGANLTEAHRNMLGGGGEGGRAEPKSKKSFVIKRGRLVPGAKDVAPTQNGALKRAEALASRFTGSAAIAVVADDETGEVARVSVLGKFGQIPADFADSLMV